ncbi:phenylacetaldoxime dehydratase [Colletotrichum orchidophilum]|uniref:Phenylacetaldoxime dehydratase n=1 Tax=Colletotrichum orchidophilum TaxID=1209926 RepID=A0A1G4B6S8_9PEZI|nr:phenylacetaldoxime dehydratase [Colletotrichum orchidophilum]OHE97094.1 phenylacetaldoxime dehydratase [Colletotrichum orchidophilum]
MLVSAIPEHLQCPRKIAAKTPPGFQPPFPAYSASFPKDTKDLVFAVIGAQYASETNVDGAAVAQQLTKFTTSKAVDAEARPQFAEWASVTDNKGYYNIAHLAYWPSKAAYDRWALDSGFQQWWENLEVESQSHGWFLEIFFPTLDRFETVFSNNEVPEGAAHMRECVRGPIQEHVYWGSMRDRMAAAQDDELVGEKVERPMTTSHANGSNGTKTNRDAQSSLGRVRVGGKHNLAVIRSGQDWSDTLPKERELYLKTMHPVLIKGMEFLRDQGEEVGCHSCRFMNLIDPVTGKADKDRTFGLAFFDELGSLEGWAKQHSTHLEIFGGFLRYAKKLENNVSLRLFHEVLVLKPEQQLFEYVVCHPGTGLLAIV